MMDSCQKTKEILAHFSHFFLDFCQVKYVVTIVQQVGLFYCQSFKFKFTFY